MSVEAEGDAVELIGAKQFFQEHFASKRRKQPFNFKVFQPTNAKTAEVPAAPIPGEVEVPTATATGTATLLSYFGCGDVADVDERDDSPNVWNRLLPCHGGVRETNTPASDEPRESTIELQLVDDDEKDAADDLVDETSTKDDADKAKSVQTSASKRTEEVLAIVEEIDTPEEHMLKVKAETRLAPNKRHSRLRTRMDAKRDRSRGRSKSKARDGEQRASRSARSRSRSRRPIKLRQEKTGSSLSMCSTGTVCSKKSWADIGSVGQKGADDFGTGWLAIEEDAAEAESDASTFLASNESSKQTKGKPEPNESSKHKKGKPDRAGKPFHFKVPKVPGKNSNAKLESENKRLREELAQLSLASENEKLRAEIARLKAQQNLWFV